MLNESSLKNLENSSYRLDTFKKYSSLEKPSWKRVGYKYEEPAEYRDFNNTTIKNENQNGLIVKDIKDSLEVMNLRKYMIKNYLTLTLINLIQKIFHMKMLVYLYI